MNYRYSKSFKGQITMRLIVAFCAAVSLASIPQVLSGKELDPVSGGATLVVALGIAFYVLSKKLKQINYLVTNCSLILINDGIQINDNKAETNTMINKSDLVEVKSNKMPFPFSSTFVKLKDGSAIDLSCFEKSNDLIEKVKELTLNL